MKHKIGPKVRKRVKARKPIPLNMQALRQAQTIEQPALAGIRSDQALYDKQEAQREANAQGFSQALAKLLGGAGPATESAYTNAAGATSSFAKGFSDAEQHIADTEGANLGSFLDKVGIPKNAAATALGKIGGTSDLLYGLQGYSPAAGLEREGAAATARDNELPAYAAGLGMQTIGQIENNRKTQDTQFENQLAAERGKIPALARQILNDMLTQQRNDESLAIQRAYLGNSTRSATANVTGVDPVTGATKPGYYKDKKGHVLPDGYVMRHGHPVRLSTAQKKGAAAYNFNKELGQASDNIYGDAKGLVTTTKSTDPLAGLDPSHPASITTKPPYAKAAQNLFNQYKYLLRQVPRRQRPKAKQLLNQTIREALAAAGITPEPPVIPTPPHPEPGVNP